MIYIKNTAAFVSFLMVFLTTLSGQENSYYTTKYTTENGLPHNRIHDILQDQTGFIWIATWNGLSRYDGSEFVNYLHDPNDPTTIPYFAIYDICCDRYNNIWVATPIDLPLGLYDRRNDRFIRYPFTLKEKNNFRPVPIYICLDTSRTLWVINNGGIEKFNYKTGSFSQINFDRHIPGKKDKVLETSDLNMMFDNQNNLWFYKNDKLFLGELTGKDSTPVINIVREYYFEQIFFCDKRSKFYTNTNGSILCISPFGRYYCKSPSTIFKQLETEELPEPFDLPGTLIWFTPGKIHVGLGFPGTVNVIAINDYEVLTLPIVDKAGNLWYTASLGKTTEYQELKKVTFIKNNFTNLFFNDLIPHDPTIFSILKTSADKLILASKIGGLIKWDSKTVRLNEVVKNTVKSFPEGILLDHQQNLWVSYDDNNLIKYNNNMKRPVNILPRFANKMRMDFITRIKVLTTDLQGNIIIGGTGGLAIFNPQKYEKIYSLRFSDQNQVRSVYENDKNDLVLGTKEDLIYLDRKTDDTTVYYLPNKNNYWIESICQYDDSIYWLGLLGEGICKWNKSKNTFRFYTSKDGLGNNTVYCILKDKKSNLWISTNKGISCFNTVSGQFINYGVDEGVMVKEFACGSCYQAPDGEMFFGGVEGVVRFYPDSIRKSGNNPEANLLITVFKVSDKSRFFDRPVYESNAITLDPGTDNFEIGFSLLEFNKTDRVKYRYLLEGYNKDWVSTDHNHRFVNYINLKPGTYRFKVDATDYLGNWSKHRILDIFIPAKFHQTIWFKALLILLSLSLLFIIIYSRYHVLILKERRKEDQLNLALKESKLEILRKQLNPHFIYNSLNSINYYISLNDKIKANQFITDFARLMRNILDNSSQEMIDFDKELETIEDYLKLEKVRYGNKFNYEIHVDETINRMATQVMPSMVQPFVENAIIYGLSNLRNQEGMLTIHFSKGNDTSVFCTIEDNGIGRKKSEKIRVKDPKKIKSRGMDIITERLTIFNTINSTDLKVKVEDIAPDQEETGTRVIMQIPAKRKL
jgi:hypothetical protein